MVRVSVRRVGSLTGKLAAALESLAALLVLATKKLKLDKPASRIFIGDDASIGARKADHSSCPRVEHAAEQRRRRLHE